MTARTLDPPGPATSDLGDVPADEGGQEAGGRPSSRSAMAPASDNQRPSFQVLDRTFAILEVFGEAAPEWSTSDIARALELPIPSVHRILSALRRLGYVAQDRRTKRFRLGTAALSLGTKARTVADLRAVAIEPLRHLSRELDETALLTGLSPDRSSSVCLERVESLLPLRLSVEPGHQLPLHAGASQKALLAFMPEDEVKSLVSGELVRLCRSTITEVRRLHKELKLTRERGFSSSYEETNVGVWGVAVPIVSESDVICAIGVAAPSARLSNEVVRRTVRLTHAASEEVARALGRSVPRLSLASATIGLSSGRK
ncbi:MAG: IclR family transcriptional regulator [Acidimicrobiales bacterium]